VPSQNEKYLNCAYCGAYVCSDTDEKGEEVIGTSLGLLRFCDDNCAVRYMEGGGHRAGLSQETHALLSEVRAARCDRTREMPVDDALIAELAVEWLQKNSPDRLEELAAKIDRRSKTGGGWDPRRRKIIHQLHELAERARS